VTVGLDTLRFVVPVGLELDGAPEAHLNKRGHLSLGSGWYAWLYNGQAFAEGSLARRFYGSNISALPVPLLGDVVRDVIRELSRFREVQSNIPFESIRVKRLDVVRDFQRVADPGPLLRSLGSVPRDARLIWDLRGHKQAESLTIGVERWSICLYDKCAETKGSAAPGHLRCEARFRDARLCQAWARDHGGCIKVVADVFEDKVESLARATFDLVGFGAEVSPAAEAVNRALAIPGFERGHQKATLLGTMVADAAQLPLAADPKTLSGYRKAIRENGITIGDPALAESMRLDWSTGEVVRGNESHGVQLLEASPECRAA
jgi:hypothetical protein